MSDVTHTPVPAEAEPRRAGLTDSPQRPLPHTTLVTAHDSSSSATTEAMPHMTPAQLRRSSSSNNSQHCTATATGAGAGATTVPLRWTTPHRPPSVLLTERRLSTSLNWPSVHRSFSTPRTHSQRSLSGRPEETAALLRQRGRSPGGHPGMHPTAFATSVTSVSNEPERRSGSAHAGHTQAAALAHADATPREHIADDVVISGAAAEACEPLVGSAAAHAGGFATTNTHSLATPRPQSGREEFHAGPDTLLHLTPTGAPVSAANATPHSGSSMPATALCTPRDQLTTSPGLHALPAPVEAYEADAAAMTRDSLEHAVRNLRTDVRVLQTNVLRTRKTLQELQRGLRQNYSAVEQDQELITNTFLRMLDAASERRRRLQLKLQRVEKEKAAKEEQLSATLHSIDQLQAHLVKEESNIQTRLQQQLHQVQVQRRHLESVLEAQSCSLQELERLVNEVQKMNEAGPSPTAATGSPSESTSKAGEEGRINTGDEATQASSTVTPITTAAQAKEPAEVATDPLTLIRFLEQEIDAANAMRNEAMERAGEYGRRKERLEQRLQEAQQTEAKEEQVVSEMQEALQCTANAVHEVNASRHFALEIESERRLNTLSGRAALSAGQSAHNEAVLTGANSARISTVPLVHSTGHLRSESMSTASSRCLTPHMTQASVPVFVTGSSNNTIPHSGAGHAALTALGGGLAHHSTIAGLLVGSAPPTTATSMPSTAAMMTMMSTTVSNHSGCGGGGGLPPPPRAVSPHLPSYSVLPCTSASHNALGSLASSSLTTTPPQSTRSGSEARQGANAAAALAGSAATVAAVVGEAERGHGGSTMSVQDTARMSAPRPLNSLETTPVKFAHIDPTVVPPLLRLTSEDKPSGAMSRETAAAATAATSADAM